MLEVITRISGVSSKWQQLCVREVTAQSISLKADLRRTFVPNCIPKGEEYEASLVMKPKKKGTKRMLRVQT